MITKPKLIVMLTHNDVTVRNAADVFEACKESRASCWGFKEEGVPLNEMKELFSYMKQCKKQTGLEVVAYSEKECLDGAKIAVECGCDILMGTKFYDSVNQLCMDNNLKYMPFIGKVSERPSILDGDIDDIIAEARTVVAKGAYGVDLLGYRYTGDAILLNKSLVAAVDAPVCIAGSINSYERLDEVFDANPSSFTIGSAFFDRKFGKGIREQINNVVNYIESKSLPCCVKG